MFSMYLAPSSLARIKGAGCRGALGYEEKEGQSSRQEIHRNKDSSWRGKGEAVLWHDLLSSEQEELSPQRISGLIPCLSLQEIKARFAPMSFRLENPSSGH